ncbi:hypothetical protein M9H77_03416 [Catharanthus roseus]|uniref:Uncharacterized protein n=1 Tax=Catharanthus roseus TaxID=4058 RepID=A0ACC0CBL5_CATRO|nr:hypothetical protein M9H77_03416 [Catharanthus roseus]
MGVAQLVLGLQSWSQEPRFESLQRQCGNFNLSNVGGPLSHHDLHPPPGRRAVWHLSVVQMFLLNKRSLVGVSHEQGTTKKSGSLGSFHPQNLSPHGLAFSSKLHSLYTIWLATDYWDTYQVYPGTNLSFKSLLTLHKVANPTAEQMRCLRRPIAPHPLQYYALFKWIHSLESETSTSSEEALIRGISQVQCNPLTLPNT